jgi:hypothetical protein
MYYIVLWCFVLQHIFIHFEVAQVKYGSGSMVQRLPLGMAAGMALMVKPALLHCASATEIASAATSSPGQVVQAADLASGLPGGVEPQTVVSPEWLKSMLSNDKLKVPPFFCHFLEDVLLGISVLCMDSPFSMGLSFRFGTLNILPM